MFSIVPHVNDTTIGRFKSFALEGVVLLDAGIRRCIERVFRQRKGANV